MKNLLSMEHLTTEEINQILDLAQAFENGETSSLSRTYKVANLFFEPSTRTKQALKWQNTKLAVMLFLLMQGFRVLRKGNDVRYCQNFRNDWFRCCHHSSVRR